MTTPASSPADLAEILVVLRAVMADERRAISRLDVTAVESLAARKHAIVEQLAAVTVAPHDGETRRLLARTRLELAATSALLAAATEGVGALLGVTPNHTYDRRARGQASTQPLRTLAL